MEKRVEVHERCAVVFDSGIGGLNLLYECVRRLPQLQYYFISDNINVPYGNKTPEQIMRITLEALEGIEQLNPAALVVACNTVTANCISDLRSRFDFPVVGIQPAIKQAAKVGKKCLVLATEATVESPSFVALINKFSTPETKVVACKELAAYIEDNVLNLPSELPEGLLPEEEADCVVLGCTHYAFVKEQIKKHYCCGVFDGIAGTAAHFAEILGTSDHFDTLSRISDHQTPQQLKVTFLKGDIDKNKRIFENMFVLKG